MWFSTNRERSLYVLGELPGAFGSLALANWAAATSFVSQDCASLAERARGDRVGERLQHH